MADQPAAPEGLSDEELQAHSAEALPPREAMSLVTGNPGHPGLPETAGDSAWDNVPLYSIQEEDGTA
jgi:hypothetical protein